MGKSLDIHVHHLTRVEGHGDIVVRASDGKVTQCVPADRRDAARL